MLNREIDFNIPNVNDPENQVYLWIQQNTPDDSTILSDTSVDNLVNQKIRLLSNRAVAVSKDFPFNEKYYVEWSDRYLDLYGGVYHNRGFVDNLSERELYKLCMTYNIDFIIRTKSINNAKYFSNEELIDMKDKQIYIYSTK